MHRIQIFTTRIISKNYWSGTETQVWWTRHSPVYKWKEITLKKKKPSMSSKFTISSYGFIKLRTWVRGIFTKLWGDVIRNFRSTLRFVSIRRLVISFAHTRGGLGAHMGSDGIGERRGRGYLHFMDLGFELFISGFISWLITYIYFCRSCISSWLDFYLYAKADRSADFNILSDSFY